MPHGILGKGKRLPNLTSGALAQGVVPALPVRGLTGSLPGAEVRQLR